MDGSFHIIKATCKGTKEGFVPNQDYIKKKNSSDFLIVSVADGLGSSRNSLEGAKLACKMTVACIKKAFQSQSWQMLSEVITRNWEVALRKKGFDKKDYQTTNSFVAIIKKSKQIIVGRIGDVLVSLRIDGKLILLDEIEKDFINETVCLGSNGEQLYKIDVFDYRHGFEFLIATDGIGDELEQNKIEVFFNYLKLKYENIDVKKRNSILKSEIIQHLSNKNADDKSIVFAWSKKSSDECN